MFLINSRTRDGSATVMRFLQLWLVVSSLYYIDTLFTANFTTDLEEGAVHKIIKYAICFGFSMYFLVRARQLGLLIISFIILFVAGLLTLMRGGLELSMLAMLTLASMGGFSMVFTVFPGATGKLAACVVYSAVIVGFFSIIELSVLSALFQSYYASTNGVRSVSTLFNPNNLGMYTGAALIFLPFVPHGRFVKLLLALPIMFALLASGSRTAWVALVATGIVMAVFDREVTQAAMRYLRRYAPVLIALAITCSMGIAFLTSESAGEIEVSHRGADLYTASVRYENFLTYMGSLDWTVLLPDLFGARAHLIQDSFYLSALSSYGLIPILFMAAFFASQVRFYWRGTLDNRQWRWVVLYYLIGGFSGSFLNSFPNNQLFFISIGAFLVNSLQVRRVASNREIQTGTA